MAKSQYNKTRTVTDKISINGHLLSDGKIIEYIDDNKEQQTIDIIECLKVFKDKDISFSVYTKSENDLDTIED